MRTVTLKLLAAALLALPLAACNTTQGLLGAGPSHIAKVDVSLAPSVGSPRFAQSLDLKIRGQAGRFESGGAAKHVRVAVTEGHYKNAAQSLLIGDGNYASAEVSVIDPATGQAQGPVKAEAIDTSGINGVVGAIISAAQDKQQVDERLADKLAWNVLVKLYGPAVAAEAGKRAPAAIEPAPQSAPRPAGTPVASAASAKPASVTR